MSVLSAVKHKLEESKASEIESEIAYALAESIDNSARNGMGAAAAVKELRSLMAEIAERSADQAVDALDELAKRRAERLAPPKAAKSTAKKSTKAETPAKVAKKRAARSTS